MRDAFPFRGAMKMDCKLKIRFATEKDIKNEGVKAEDSRYYKIMKEKKDKQLRKQGKPGLFDKSDRSKGIKRDLRKIINGEPQSDEEDWQEE